MAPGVVLLNAVAKTVAPLHTAKLAGTVTTAVGFTVMVKLELVPTQPLADGVNVIVAVIGKAVVLVAVNEGRFPVPLAAKPMAVLLLVHA